MKLNLAQVGQWLMLSFLVGFCLSLFPKSRINNNTSSPNKTIKPNNNRDQPSWKGCLAQGQGKPLWPAFSQTIIIPTIGRHLALGLDLASSMGRDSIIMDKEEGDGEGIC